MVQNRFAGKISLIVLLGLFIGIHGGMAQPDCRSILGAYLKPAGKTSLSWAIEGIGAAGVMPGRTLAHWSLYGGADFSADRHQGYFEGAYKGWYNSASNPDGADPQTGLPDYNRPTRYHWGFRELFYRYGTRESFVKFGIQSLNSSDYLMFDERMLGISASKQFSAFRINVNTGTVNQRLARFQDVCGTRHVYNLFHRSEFNFVGEKLGETNFAAAFLTWTPSGRKTKSATVSDDEFSTSEFGTDEFSAATIQESSAFELKEGGLFFYEEFGPGFHEYKYYSGGFASLSMPAEFSLKAEVVGQYIPNDHAVAYWLKLAKSLVWNGGSPTQMEVSYLGKFDISKGAHFYPAFSNLMLGEVMRLDAIDLPLVSASAKHHFNGMLKPSLQLNGVMQTNGNHSKELDLIAGIKILHHARLTAICSYLHSDLLSQDTWLAKLELRIAL